MIKKFYTCLSLILMLATAAPVLSPALPVQAAADITADGSVSTGWVSKSGNWYYFDQKDGRMKTGWIKDKNKWYYLSSKDGKMVTGWLVLNPSGKKYYLQKDGSMVQGPAWASVGSGKYFINENGEVSNGWELKNGKWYYYTTDGSCPCQDTPGRREYTGPVSITENTNFIIAAYKDGMDYSDKVHVNVTVGSWPFIDVNEQTPHAYDICWLSAAGISTGWDVGNGKREFRGEGNVIRQDMAAFLYRLAGSPAYIPTPADVATFVDVDSTNPDVNRRTPHYMEILWLASEGISQGWDVGEGRREFRGMDTVKRQDMAAFLRRLAGHMEANIELPEGADNPFYDVDGSTPHYEDIIWLASTGVTTGWDEGSGRRSYRGMNDVLRQDMAAFLHRLDTYIKNNG